MNIGMRNGIVDDSMILMIRHSPDRNSSSVFEDDGRVAYAYYRTCDGIVGDVWLYNRNQAPEVPEWKSNVKPPYANSSSFTKDCKIQPIVNETDFDVVWNDGTAEIYLHKQIWARLREGDRPGECVLATRSGPLATPLVQ